MALSQNELLRYPASVRSKSQLIYNGVDASLFKPRRSALDPNKEFRLLYVGQIIKLKRVHLAVRMVANLRKRGVPAQLTIATHRPTLLPEVLTTVQSLGVEKFVQVQEGLTQKEISCQMDAAHLLVLPSRTEALSTVITEAVLSGLPVLGFDVGGISEQVPPGTPILHHNDSAGFLEAAWTVHRLSRLRRACREPRPRGPGSIQRRSHGR